MSIIWADFPSGDLGIYGTDRTRMLDGVWSAFMGDGLTIQNDPDPGVGAAGKVLRALNGSGTVEATVRYALPAGPTTTVGVGCRMWVAGFTANEWSNTPLIGFTTGSNIPVVYAVVTPTGSIKLTSNYVTGMVGNPNTIADTLVPVLTANSWNHVEIKVTRGASDGVVELRVNSQTVLVATGLVLGANDPALVHFGVTHFKTGSGTIGYFKDIVIWDTVGSQNNNFLGAVSVYILRPDADVAFPWTPSTGTTGFNLIDETGPPNDSDFISAADPPPALSEFTVGDLPPDIVGVRALLPVVRAKKIDGGDGNIQTGVKGTLTDLGEDRPITTAFSYWYDVSELSPDTAAPWTPLEVNNAKLTINRTV